ncbi:MAG: 16S rRNA (adenine(1518)-N(6)/adenine(1519)-N(6))-dimethyltransferase RsmA [Planctomycetota bacterium]
MQTLAEIRELLESRGMAPRKKLGQNFLLDHNLIRKLVDASGVGDGDLVLEVGPGTGALTDELLARGCTVIACELDAGLAALQRERQAAATKAGRFTLIEGDCLAGKRGLNPAIVEAIGSRAFALVANLPYGAATPLMLALLCDERCTGQHVTIQREVADRLLAGPGSKAYGSISVVAQTLATVERVAALPPECFWPRPDVTSAMVSLRPIHGHDIDDRAAFAAFCQQVFANRRKQLGKVLAGIAGGVSLPEGVATTDRAERLDVRTIAGLYRSTRGG